MRDNRPMWDLGAFGYRELNMAADLLKAICNSGYPDDFDDDGVRIEFNPYSGNVFLTNDNGDCCMEVEGKLESWYFLSYHGYEGFLDDLIDAYDNGDIEEEDLEQLADICEANGKTEKANEIRNEFQYLNSDQAYYDLTNNPEDV